MTTIPREQLNTNTHWARLHGCLMAQHIIHEKTREKLGETPEVIGAEDKRLQFAIVPFEGINYYLGYETRTWIIVPSPKDPGINVDIYTLYLFDTEEEYNNAKAASEVVI